MNDRPVALVTGASGGIGTATAAELAERGYNLALTSLPGEDLDRVARLVEQRGGEAITLPGDLADLDWLEGAVRTAAQRWGRLDVLVNNAAWRELVTMRRITVESWERTLRVSLTAPAFLARWAAEAMEPRRRGVIVNISSVHSTRGSGISPAYTVVKGGLDALTYELAALYGPVGIRVVAVNPGAVDTPMSGDYTAPTGVTPGDSITDAMARAHNGLTPLRRFAQPAEIARAVAMLCGDDASYITGTTITVDGGFLRNTVPYELKQRMHPEDFKS